jgi:hypothetical protein
MKKRKAKLVGFSTRLEASVARKLKSFTKKNKLTISEVTNSAIKVFISEAEAIEKEIKIKRSDLYAFKTDDYIMPKLQGRITTAYGTDDAIKSLKLRK